MSPIASAALEEAAALLTVRLGHRVGVDVPLAPMTTYRVGGPAALFVDVARDDDLAAVAEAHAATGVPILVVGRGSNMLVADRGFDGIALSVANFAPQIELPADRGAPGDPCSVVAGGGVALPVLARRTAAASITGFEWAVGVPGSIGGAVRMNAGGHGSDMATCVVAVTTVDLSQADLGRRRIGLDQLDFGFRSSALSGFEVVLDATLRLAFGDRSRSEREISEIVHWRREHQPGGQNCGSVFVNPVPGEVAAGALIDGLGLRGFRIGSAEVSEKHANFIQADEGGSADDVRSVMEHVRSRVAAETGYQLRTEVRLVGFEDGGPS